jgi:deazaflavin-dependent oxidoreductase (nitroreductase family)
MSDWNAGIIDEFRANHGRVGGRFEGAPLILLHHRGRKSGADHVSPAMSLAHESDPDTLYVFASKGGAPTDPEWYRNLIARASGRVEVGDGEYEVDVTELEGEARDRIFAEQASRSGLRGIRGQDGWHPHDPGVGAPAPALNHGRGGGVTCTEAGPAGNNPGARAVGTITLKATGPTAGPVAFRSSTSARQD